MSHTQCSHVCHADLCRGRTSILAVIWRLSWHAGAALGVIAPASMLPKSSRVLRVCTPRVLSIVISSLKISLSLPMATSYTLTLGSPRSSHVALRRMPRQVHPRSQERHTG